jgi:hypothetical protein
LKWSPRRGQHHGEKFVAQLEVVTFHTVVRHQQPSAASLLNIVNRHARGGLHHQCHQGV